MFFHEHNGSKIEAGCSNGGIIDFMHFLRCPVLSREACTSKTDDGRSSIQQLHHGDVKLLLLFVLYERYQLARNEKPVIEPMGRWWRKSYENDKAVNQASCNTNWEDTLTSTQCKTSRKLRKVLQVSCSCCREEEPWVPIQSVADCDL